jgi:hypothetical protein
MAEETEIRFKDDWNFNKGFLEYCLYLVQVMGYCRRNKDPVGWYDTASELLDLVSDMVDPKVTKELDDKLEAIYNVFNVGSQNPQTREGKIKNEETRMDGINLLHDFTRTIMTGMHRARMIMPKSDKRTGLKRLEEEYGINDDNSNKPSQAD